MIPGKTVNFLNKKEKRYLIPTGHPSRDNKLTEAASKTVEVTKRYFTMKSLILAQDER